MLKIAHISPYFHVHEIPAGIEIHVYELAKYLIKEGIESPIYASRTKQIRSIIAREDAIEKGLDVRRFPAAEASVLPLAPKQGWPIPLAFFSKAIRECDIVHLHGQEFVTSFVASLTAKRLGIPAVITVHNSGWTLEDEPLVKIARKVFYKTIFAATINAAKRIIVPSERNFPVLRYLVHREIVRIPHFVDLDRFDVVEKDPEHVLYLGRLEPVKGIEYFVRAIPLVLKKVDANFVIAGHGSMKSSLTKLMQSKQIGNRVTFINGISYENVPRLLAKASVFVAPGHSGLTILEAAASKTPIVTVDSPWNLSMIDEKSALVVKEKDARELAKGTVALLEDKRLSKNLSTRARKFVEEQRSWKTGIKRYINLYKEVAEKNGNT